MNKLFDELISQRELFFRFMKEKYPVYKNSNIFLRDIQYAIKSYFEKKEIFLRSDKAELAAREFTAYLQNNNLLAQINSFTWKVLFSLEDSNPVKEEQSSDEQQ